MYSAYNAARVQTKKTLTRPASPECSSSSNNRQTSKNQRDDKKNSNDQNINSTPKKQERSEKFNKLSNADQQRYTMINSPLKLQQLINNHSPRKSNVNKNDNTPRSKNPFESDSGGGKGSPSLFADLIVHSKETTPRTKARKFLIGMGSPLKVKKINDKTEVDLSITAGGGLSSFLTDSSKGKQQQEGQEENEEDEVLGPSPFKPKPNSSFRPLFEQADHSAKPDLRSSPSSSQADQRPKWKVNSVTPFISQSLNNTTPSQPILLESAQQQKSNIKKEPIGFKRKRHLNNEEESKFYEDLLTDGNPHSKNSRSTGKLRRVLSNQKRLKKAGSNIEGDNRSASLRRNKTMSKVTVDPQKLAEREEEQVEDDNSESRLPPLPSGDPNQKGVYTQIEVYSFEPRNRSSTHKGKEKSTEDSLIESSNDKPIKLGLKKVLVRPYQFKKNEETQNTNEVIRPDSLEEEEEEIEDSGAEEEEDDDDDDNAKEEGDLLVSEELMKILSIKDNQNMKYEKQREIKVERILSELEGLEEHQQRSFGMSNKNKNKSKKSLGESIKIGDLNESKDEFKFELTLDRIRSDSEEDNDDDLENDDDWDNEPEGWKEVQNDIYNDLDDL